LYEVKNKGMDVAKLYDLSFLNKISGGDKTFINEMISTFKQVAPEYLLKAKGYLAAGSIESLSKETHRMIPGVSFLGAKFLEEDLLKIEDYTKNQKNLDQIPELLKSVDQKIAKLLAEFENDFN
jgi:HPt (histidine-containing phosphotransfer) domain-containing protein